MSKFSSKYGIGDIIYTVTPTRKLNPNRDWDRNYLYKITEPLTINAIQLYVNWSSETSVRYFTKERNKSVPEHEAFSVLEAAQGFLDKINA